MFKEFFFLELQRSLKRPMIYLFFGIVALLVFAATSSDSVMIGGPVGNVLRNAPTVITNYTTILTLLGLLFAAAFFNNAALRDHNNQFHEILFSTPISKSGYFFGRFFAALILSTLPILGVFFGFLVGSVLAPAFGWIPPERFGPFYPETFINNYLLFILPNMFFSGTVIFGLATRFRSTVVSFIGAIGIIIGYSISLSLLSDLENETLAALTDTFGISAYNIDIKYFTPIEKNTISPGFNGLVLISRLIWTGVGMVILTLNYLTFSFKPRAGKVRKQREKKSSGTKPVLVLPNLSAQFDFGTTLSQFGSFFMTNFRSIVKSVTFRVLFLFSLILLVTNLWGGFEYFGLQSYPVTYKMLDTISSLSSLFILIVLVFFSGELVWRDRDQHINEVIDASPHNSTVSLFAKALSLVSTGSLIYLFFVLFAVIYQLFNGYTKLELDLYALSFLYKSFPAFLVWSCVMILVQVLLNNKYIGYFVSVALIFFLDILFSILEISSNMVNLGGSPSIEYSDMAGFGPALGAVHWFNLYWGLFALLGLLIAALLWNRGVSFGFKNRLKGARKALSLKYALIMGAIAIMWLATGGWVFYNTQVLNPYKSSDAKEEVQVAYELAYKKYENLPKPSLTKATFNLDIYPSKRDVYVKADMQMKNKSGQVINDIHFTVEKDWNHKISIPGAKRTFNDSLMGYQIYELAAPMQAGDSIDLVIEAALITKGFENQTSTMQVLENGTFLNNMSFLPAIGYSSGAEISDRNDRRKYDLPPKVRMPPLQKECTDLCMKNYLTDGAADWVDVETFISTSGDQIAIAPGSLVKEWQEEGRNHYHYVVDHPSQAFFSFISARYEVARRKWNDLDLEVYYHAGHKTNVEMMLDAMQKSLAYYIKNFGPYYHKQARIIEFPRYATFAQAFPGTMPYSEAFGFIVNLEDSSQNNVVDAVIAHEMAHQWWAHQVIGANMQGGTMLSESFSEYSSLMVMHQEKDDLEMKDFIKYDLSRYLRGRSREAEKEVPLFQVENQGHIHYGKGAVVLYGLQDYIGEDKVNRAMRCFLEEYRYKEPPYPTSLNFLAYLEREVPDSMQYLITDWFKEITLYDHRLKEATYSELPDGNFLVDLKIESKKIKADSLGNETDVPINDWVEIGIFSDSDPKKPIIRKMVKFDQATFNISFEVDEKPEKAVIDPRKILIERVFSDNSKTISKSGE